MDRGGVPHARLTEMPLVEQDLAHHVRQPARRAHQPDLMVGRLPFAEAATDHPELLEPGLQQLVRRHLDHPRAEDLGRLLQERQSAFADRPRVESCQHPFRFARHQVRRLACQAGADAGQQFSPSHVVFLDFLVEPDFPTELGVPFGRRIGAFVVGGGLPARDDRTLESFGDDGIDLRQDPVEETLASGVHPGCPAVLPQDHGARCDAHQTREFVTASLHRRAKRKYSFTRPVDLHHRSLFLAPGRYKRKVLAITAFGSVIYRIATRTVESHPAPGVRPNPVEGAHCPEPGARSRHGPIHPCRARSGGAFSVPGALR